MSNYPDGVSAADPRAPWNRVAPEDAGCTCGMCCGYEAAPDELARVPFGRCHHLCEWVRPDDPACDDGFEAARRSPEGIGHER